MSWIQRHQTSLGVGFVINTLSILPFSSPARGTVTVPGSKSITNRALLLGMLAGGEHLLTGALESEDSQIFASCLQQLGGTLTLEPSAIRISSRGGPSSASDADLFVGNAGTAARFLPAFVSLGVGTFRFDGVPAMRSRPIADLLAALRDMGAQITCEREEGCFPFTIRANGLSGGNVTMNASASSQQVSALMLAAPAMQNDLVIKMTGNIVSRPYLEITRQMMSAWGVEAVITDDTISVPARSTYVHPPVFQIEPDASSASYFFAAAAATGGCVTVRGLHFDSLQGDVAFVDVLQQMGCRVYADATGLTVEGPTQLRGLTVDMGDISDTAPTLAAIATLATTPVTITGVEHMRWKETDRIAAMQQELSKLGAQVTATRDGLVISPGRLRSANVDTYDDHRIAMSLAVGGLANAGVVINDPGCVDKTFPHFWSTLAALREQSSPLRPPATHLPKRPSSDQPSGA